MNERRFAIPYVQDIVLDPDAETVWGTEEDLELPPDVRRKPWLWSETDGGPLPGGAFPGVGPPTGPAGRAALYASFPPHFYPPQSAYILDYPLDRLPVAIVAGGSAVFAFPRVPQGNRGVCRKIAAVVTLGALADARFTTRINLSPVQPFPGIRGGIGTIEAPQDTQVILAASDLFDLLVENTGIAPLSVAVRLYGWWWTDDKA